MIPEPRPSVADPALWRPDHLQDGAREPRKLWLDKNENSDPAYLALVAEVIGKIAPAAISTYPDAAPLYRKLARWVGVDPRSLMLAAGSDGAIRSVFESFVSAGDLVMITEPTFAMYPVYARMYGARTMPLRYSRSNAGPFLAYADAVAAIRTHKPRVVCLPNPDSPTGTVCPPAMLRDIIAAAGAAGAVMLVDEAYHPFHADSVVPLIAEFPHLVVARTAAKAWGLAGLRIGYAVAAPELAAMLHKVRPMYECGTMAMAGFESMLDHADAMEASVRRLEAGKAAFLDAMEDLGFATLRGKGNFLHVAFGHRADEIHAVLGELCYYRRDFAEPCLKGFSRFSATTAERFAPVVRAIRSVVKGAKND